MRDVCEDVLRIKVELLEAKASQDCIQLMSEKLGSAGCMLRRGSCPVERLRLSESIGNGIKQSPEAITCPASASAIAGTKASR
jgi:hypothetical protein